MKERIEQLLEQSVGAYDRLLSSCRKVEKAVSAGCDAGELEAIMARMKENGRFSSVRVHELFMRAALTGFLKAKRL